MNSRSLIRWSALEERRRRTSLGGVASWSGLWLSLFLGVLLAAEMTRRLAGASGENLVHSAVGASQLWVAVAVAGYAIGVFGAPFRLYWRRDSKLLASLPMPGKSLFLLALWRSQLTGLWVSLALLCALVPFGIWVDWELASRHLLLVAIGYAGAAWLGPAAALFAGAIVASDKAQAMIASMSGEFQAPRTTWLGLMPGLAATTLTVSMMAAAPWTLGGRPAGGSIVLIAAIAIGIPLLVLGWASGRADQVIPAAVREVAALDQEILAHIERSTPSVLERSFYKLTLSGSALTLAHKDASLSRRRYPTPYFLIPCGIAALWVIAGAQPEAYLPWGGALFGSLVVYALVMARRSWVPSIEIPKLIATLPVGKGQVARAKGVQALLRIVMIITLGGVAFVLRAPDLWSALSLVVGTSVLTTMLSLRSR